MGKLGAGRKIAVRKRLTRIKERKKKSNACPLTTASSEVPIINEAQSTVEDSAFTFKPVDHAVASPNPSSCGSSPHQARASTPWGQLPSDRLLTASPIEFVPLPADNNLAPSRETHSEGVDNVANKQSVDVCLGIIQPQLKEETNTLSDILIQSRSVSVLEDVVPFKVAEIEFLDTSEENSRDTSYELEKSSEIEILESSQDNNHDASCEVGLEGKTQTTVSPAETFNLKELQTRIQNSLPRGWLWIGSTRPGDDGITLFKVPTTGLSLLQQRQITILGDGTVHLFVHGKALNPDHEIWSQLPPKLSFASQSVENLYGYVLAVVKVVHGYEMCPGCPLPQQQYMARKMGAVFSPNTFRERKYTTTHRSVDCGLLVVPTRKLTACPSCKTMRVNIRKRLARKSSIGSPKASTNNKLLYTPQVKKKLQAEKLLKRNALAREKYYRKKLAVLIRVEGTDIEGGLSEELCDILEHRRNLSGVLGSEDNQDDSENSGNGNSPKKKGKLNNLLRVFIEEQIKASKVKRACGMRWHPLMIRLALRIYMTSASAYRALGSCGIIKLPSERTLFDYSHHDKTEEGIDRAAVREIYNSLNKEYAEDSHQRYHVLLMDEMCISKNLVYSRATGELTGFVKLTEIEKEAEKLQLALETVELRDDSERPTNERLVDSDEAQLIRQKAKELLDYGDVVPDIADKMLTFMVVGVTNKVRTVVASYGVKKTTAEFLSSKVWDVIGKLERANIYVLGLVCDGHPVNRSFIKKHEPSHEPLPSGTVYSTTNLVARSRDLFFFSDVPHLLKTLRNCFFNSEGGKKSRCLKRNGEFITWRTIVKLFNDEKDSELRMAHKLNAQVVYLNNYSGMKVAYAARVLSRTVANAIEAKRYPYTKETVKFIRKANDFFDCLNGSSSSEGIHKRNRNLDPYRSADDPRFKGLREYLDDLLKWSREVEDPRFCISPETLCGIEMTINSFEKCCQFMFSKGAKFIMARRFCQDPLEQFFGKQRASCGGSTNPNMSRFLGNQNKIRIIGKMKETLNGNTETLSENTTLEDLSTPLLKRKPGTGVDGRVKMIRRSLVSDTDFTSAENVTL